MYFKYHWISNSGCIIFYSYSWFILDINWVTKCELLTNLGVLALGYFNLKAVPNSGYNLLLNSPLIPCWVRKISWYLLGRNFVYDKKSVWKDSCNSGIAFWLMKWTFRFLQFWCCFLTSELNFLDSHNSDIAFWIVKWKQFWSLNYPSDLNVIHQLLIVLIQFQWYTPYVAIIDGDYWCYKIKVKGGHDILLFL